MPVVPWQLAHALSSGCGVMMLLGISPVVGFGTPWCSPVRTFVESWQVWQAEAVIVVNRLSAFAPWWQIVQFFTIPGSEPPEIDVPCDGGILISETSNSE